MYLSKEALLDYTQCVVTEIAKCFKYTDTMMHTVMQSAFACPNAAVSHPATFSPPLHTQSLLPARFSCHCTSVQEDISAEAIGLNEKDMMKAMGLPTTFSTSSKKKLRKPSKKTRKEAEHFDTLGFTAPPLVNSNAAGCDFLSATVSSSSADTMYVRVHTNRIICERAHRQVIELSSEGCQWYDSALNAQLHDLKEKFSAIDGKVFRRARDCANPFEFIGAGYVRLHQQIPHKIIFKWRWTHLPLLEQAFRVPFSHEVG